MWKTLRAGLALSVSPWVWVGAIAAYIAGDPLQGFAFGPKRMNAALSEIYTNISDFIGNPLVRFAMIPVFIFCFYRAAQSVSGKYDATMRRETSERKEALRVPILVAKVAGEKLRLLKLHDQVRAFELNVHNHIQNAETWFVGEPKSYSSRTGGCIPGTLGQNWDDGHVAGAPDWNPAWEMADAKITADGLSSVFPGGMDRFDPADNGAYIDAERANHGILSARVVQLRAFYERKSREVEGMDAELEAEIERYGA